MRCSRLVWTASAVLVLVWSTATIRGDQPLQPLQPPKAPRQAGPPDDDSTDDARMSSTGRVAHLAATGRLDKTLRNARRRAAVQAGHVQEFLDTELGGDDAGGDHEDAPAGGQAETSIA